MSLTTLREDQMATFEAIATFFFLFLIIIIWFMITKNKSPIIQWPVFGMLPGILFNAYRIHDYCSDVLNLVSNHTIEVKGPWFSKMNVILTSDPENIHYIFSRKFSNFNKGATFKKIFEVLGDGILAAESDSWKMQRKLIHSLFTQNNFLKFVETTSQRKVETRFFKILDHVSDNGLQVDIQDLFLRFAFDVTCTFLLGSDLNSLSLELPEIPVAKAADAMEEILLNRHFMPESLWKLQKWLHVGMVKRETEAIKTIDNFIYQQIFHKQEQNYKRSAKGGSSADEAFDLISNFMVDIEVAAKCQSLDKPLQTFLRDSTLSILSAGRDSTAASLTWFFWLVSSYPLIESKIRHEIEVIFQMEAGDPWRFPTCQKLNELIYLHATLCETLRLYPPVPLNHKASIKPDILPSGHSVNEETKIIFSIYAMGRMEEIWGADFREFKPERWISEKGSIRDMPSYKYNTFGAGPRTCVGKDLAFRVLKIVAAAIIWSYDIRTIKDHPVIPTNSVVLHMKHGLQVNVTKKCKF